MQLNQFENAAGEMVTVPPEDLTWEQRNEVGARIRRSGNATKVEEFYQWNARRLDQEFRDMPDPYWAEAGECNDDCLVVVPERHGRYPYIKDGRVWHTEIKYLSLEARAAVQVRLEKLMQAYTFHRDWFAEQCASTPVTELEGE